MTKHYDYVIIGAGIVGLSLARRLAEVVPAERIAVIEKEARVGAHASGRNSGILHAGFYYTADSFKARFTVAGNQAMKRFCAERGIPVNACGKLVVAQDEAERCQLHVLFERGMKNGSRVSLISEAEAREIEPGVRTFREALYSPDTASLDPLRVCEAIYENLKTAGVVFCFNARYIGARDGVIETTAGEFSAGTMINCAGLYADRVARDVGLARRYTMIPFKGLYLKYAKNTTDVRINVYPVPNLNNPFLGVHFTKTVDDHIKIGPTAIPAFWRENYAGVSGFRVGEAAEILTHEARLFLTNAFHFRDLAFEEIRKYGRRYFISLAQQMIPGIDPEGFGDYTPPGIRAQLLDIPNGCLVQDFVVEATPGSVHILNAVSPAFTCAFPFADYIYTTFLARA